MPSRLWIYAGEGQTSGPASTGQVAELLRSGELTPDSRIRPEKVDSWASVSVWLPEILDGAAPPLPPAPPPLPGAKGAWTDTQPHPWRRYLARLFDALVVGSLTWFLISIAFYMTAPEAADAFFSIFDKPGGAILDAMLTLLAMIPATALMIGLTGVSVGKWIFGIKVVTPAGKSIGVIAAFSREIQVWLFGLAAGLPLISLATLLAAYNTLTEDKHAGWDKPAKRIVLHRPMNALQIILIVLAVPLLIAGRVGLLLLSQRG